MDLTRDFQIPEGEGRSEGASCWKAMVELGKFYYAVYVKLLHLSLVCFVLCTHAIDGSG